MLRSLLLCVFALCCSAFTAPTLAQQLRPATRSAAANVQMLRQCDISGKRSNYAHRVTFSNKKNPKMQHPNLQTKTFFSPALNRNVNVKIACSTIRTIRKLGLDETAAHFGCDLSKF